MYKDSIYTKINQDSESRVAMGYDYSKNGLISKFVSPTLFGNTRLGEFLNKIDKLLIEIVDSVKRIQFFFNFTIDKNDRRHNI